MASVLFATAIALGAQSTAEPTTQPTTRSLDQPTANPTNSISLPPPLPESAAATTRPSTASSTLSAPATEPAVPGPAVSDAPTTRPAISSPSSRESAPSTQPVISRNSVMAPPPAAGQVNEVTITADLDRTRDQIAPSLGAVKYTMGPNQLQDIPGGQNAPFQQVLLRAPGVVEDSFGQEHVRGEHGNLLYRVDGVILPTSIGSLGGFGQELDSRIINSVTLIDGSLPAQFGFRTAGVVDVTTKSGASLNHNEFSLYGGSFDTFQPSLQLGGTIGKWDYFIAGSYKYSGQGIENPTSSTFPLHDYTNQERAFGYIGYRIDDTSRLTLLLNGSYGTFQIPDSPGVAPSFTLANHPTFNSASVNENQNELDNYEVLSYQKTLDKLSLQASLYSRYGRIKFNPDSVGDLMFTGVAGKITNGFLTDGAQFDAAYVLDDHNTLRFGFLGDYTSEAVGTNTAVFPLDANGNQASDTPFAITDRRGNWGYEYGFYLQNEWKIADPLTLNFGARYDRFDASFDHEDQVSPRVNLVWKIDNLATAHAGYARYFVPPPVQYIWPQTVAKYNGTSNTPENFGDSPLRAERSNYYDIGLSRQIAPALQATVDAFYKAAGPLIDNGQFGSAVILAPFNYRQGKDYGAEFSTTYKQGGLSLFSNFSWVSATGKDIDSSEYLIGNDELAYISKHFIHLDHESEYTVSAGASYTWKDNRVYADILYGSGLRAGFANTQKQPDYYPVNVGFEHIFHIPDSAVAQMRFRLDIVNVFDQVYQLRDGSGVGVGAPQFGSRRGIYAGLTFDF